MGDNQYTIDISTNADSTSVEELASKLQEVENNADSAGNAIGGIDTGQLGAVDSEAKDAAGNLGNVDANASNAGTSIKGISPDTVKEVAKSSNEASAGLNEGASAADLMSGALAAIVGLGIADTMYSLADAAGAYDESWERIALLTGSSMDIVKDKWGGAISEMQSETGRGAGVIRGHIQAMSIAGVKDTKAIEDSFAAISAASFATGNDLGMMETAYQRTLQTGVLSSRTLMALGINEEDISKTKYKNLDNLKDAFKSMTADQRAMLLAQIVNEKSGEKANEAYKESWQYVKDQVGLAGDYIQRVVGATILPLLIPALETATSWLKQLGDWFNGLNAPSKAFLGTVIVVGGALGIAGSAIATIITLKNAFAAVTALSRIAQEGETAATVTNTAAKEGSILSTISQTASTVAHTAVEGIRTGVTYAAAAAQWALNAAMSANPIAIIIIAIIALVAILIYLWTTNEGFRNAVIGAWAAISGAFINAGHQIYGALMSIWNTIRYVFVGLPQQMYNWGVSAINGFINAIINSIPGLRQALDLVSYLFPHSPPKTGPLATITAGNMFAWASDIASAGMSGFASFNLNGINTTYPAVGTGYGSASIGYDATVINDILTENSKSQPTIINHISVYQDGIMSQDEAAEFTVKSIKAQLWKENIIAGKVDEQ